MRVNCYAVKRATWQDGGKPLRVLLEDQESFKPAGPIVAQQPSDEQPEEEPPTESKDITPDHEKEDEGAPECQKQGLTWKADLQELAQPKTEGEDRDGPDVKGEVVTKTRNHLHVRSRGRTTTGLKEDELKSCKLLSGIFVKILSRKFYSILKKKKKERKKEKKKMDK
ncbi:uncharacterized protein RBU33_004916 [Hipposideros larvatus]